MGALSHTFKNVFSPHIDENVSNIQKKCTRHKTIIYILNIFYSFDDCYAFKFQMLLSEQLKNHAILSICLIPIIVFLNDWIGIKWLMRLWLVVWLRTQLQPLEYEILDYEIAHKSPCNCKKSTRLIISIHVQSICSNTLPNTINKIIEGYTHMCITGYTPHTLALFHRMHMYRMI